MSKQYESRSQEAAKMYTSKGATQRMKSSP